MKSNKNKSVDEAGQWAEDVLNSLEGIQRASSNPFLYTRVMARIEAGQGGWAKAANLLSRPAFAFASIAVLIGINVAVISFGGKNAEAEVAKKVTVEQMLAAEFSNTPSYSLVDINEEK